MRHDRLRPVFLLCTALLLPAFFACGPSKEELVQNRVASLVAEFRKKESRKCHDMLLAEAGKIADSLLLHEALDEVTDSLARLRPFKPVKPASIPPIDSLQLKPIFDQ
ncbi:MAG: hypothetical protein IT260_18195 [Saprospiraceae bacterium]|nr:hypothetical protein [Saprospiraceae bacterium]